MTKQEYETVMETFAKALQLVSSDDFEQVLHAQQIFINECYQQEFGESLS